LEEIRFAVISGGNKMKDVKPHIAFMSCEPEDEKRLETQLRQIGLKYIVGEGCYKGVKEKSYMIFLSTYICVATQKLEQVVTIAQRFNQESVLYCDNERFAYLLYVDGVSAPCIGTLKAVSKPEGDYSRFNGAFYEVTK
jgi:hypothetical protein